MDNLAMHKTKLYKPEDMDDIDILAKEIKKSIYPPKYHIYPKAGLMNDPNGLAYFNNQYHIFFQWYPYAPVHGLKNWGHTTTHNFKDYSYQEMALVPDEMDRDGCYSGNAIEKDGKLYLFYTGNYKTDNGKIPKQCLAIMDKDGHIEKIKQPIIEEVHEEFSGELRDPFVFEDNGFYYMLLGGGKFNTKERVGFGDEGIILLYKSSDLLHWDYQGLIDMPIDTGYMLECPSLVRINGKDILYLSVMGAKVEEEKLNNQFVSMVAIGKLDIENMRFIIEQYHRADDGFDFYATQTFYGKDKVPMALSWFGCGEQDYPDQEQWKHGLTFTQELSFVDNKLKRFPVKDILDIFTNKQELTSQITLIHERCYRVHLDKGFDFKIGQEDDYWEFSYNQETKTATLSRENLKKPVDTKHGVLRKTEIDCLEEIDIFVDHSFIEVYLNQGEKVFTFVEFQENNKNLYILDECVKGYIYREE